MNDIEKEKAIAKKYSKLGNEYQLKNIYRGIFDGRLTINSPEIQRLLKVLINNDQLLEFINFLTEADSYGRYITVGSESYDWRDDRYTKPKEYLVGYGDVVISGSLNFVKPFLIDLDRKFAFEIRREKENKEKQQHEIQMKLYEEHEKQMLPKRQAYDKFMADYQNWCKKDPYWHALHADKLPTPEKYGLIEADLREFGYYYPENVEQRIEDYRKACNKYKFYGNASLKKLFTGKRVPIASDYGLTEQDLTLDFEENYGVSSEDINRVEGRKR